jgi:hypothetical protein
MLYASQITKHSINKVSLLNIAVHLLKVVSIFLAVDLAVDLAVLGWSG